MCNQVCIVLEDGVTVRVDKDCSLETIEALRKMIDLVRDNPSLIEEKISTEKS